MTAPSSTPAAPASGSGDEDGSLRVVVNCMSDEETSVVSERLREALGWCAVARSEAWKNALTSCQCRI